MFCTFARTHEERRRHDLTYMMHSTMQCSCIESVQFVFDSQLCGERFFLSVDESNGIYTRIIIVAP